MTTLIVNGRPVTAEIEGRTHLADFLRDHLLLTGTHTGCEHGVCGACTVLLGDEPIRACITTAALCDGADIRTIEGLDDDPIAIRLREAFTAEHALQCGYCTPGMLVTARDIVQRLPQAEDATIRLELAGNLCRCTGYNGIVRAIRRVLDEHLPIPHKTSNAIGLFPPSLLQGGAGGGSATEPKPTPNPPPSLLQGGAGGGSATSTKPNQTGLTQNLQIPVSPEILWTALQSPTLIASAIPGATLTRTDGPAIEGEMRVALGPVRVRFAGTATLAYDPATQAGTVTGGGNDQASGTRVTATARFQVRPDGPAGSILAVTVDYALRGPLSQLAKPRIVDMMAGDIAAQFAQALSARLRGESAPAPAPLSGGALMLRVALRWLRTLFSRK